MVSVRASARGQVEVEQPSAGKLYPGMFACSEFSLAGFLTHDRNMG